MTEEEYKTKQFRIGPLTMAKVFAPAGLTNISDLQAVFNAMETALDSPRFFSKHDPLPRVLVRLETEDGRKSVMLCSPSLDDLDERLKRYAQDWNSTFKNPIRVVNKETIE